MGDTKYLTKIAEEKIKNADIIVLRRTQNISTEEVNKINDEIIKEWLRIIKNEAKRIVSN